MAALRVMARRLVGGGQTPAVAVEKAQRRLFPRLSQVGRARSTTSSAAAAADTNMAAGKSAKQGCEDGDKLLAEIHNMREELYDKVSHAERTYYIPGREGKNISRLRDELATQVDPRPGDTKWRQLRALTLFWRYFGSASVMFTSYVLARMATGGIVELEPHEKRWLEKKREEARKRSKAK